MGRNPPALETWTKAGLRQIESGEIEIDKRMESWIEGMRKIIRWTDPKVNGAVHITPEYNLKEILAWSLNAGSRTRIHLGPPATGDMWYETERRRSDAGTAAYIAPDWPTILKMGHDVRLMSNGVILIKTEKA